ncbi:MAG: hypothetical protein JXA25_09335 [Anaerolineales bacterium]|nr:hypothetical protein [Anaerolineales bacterium]
MKNQRLALAAGLIFGLLAGLAYAWMINPVQYSRTVPGCLPEEYQQQYVSLIASAYAATGDLSRASLRLALLDLKDTSTALDQFSLQAKYDKTSFEQQALQQLASALQPALLTPEAQPTELPSGAGYQPIPATTAPEVMGNSLNLVEMQRVCDPELRSPMILFHIQDQSGAPLPGILIQVLWENGYNRFYTGLKPAPGSGYADFSMDDGYTYSVRVAGMPGQITDLQVEDCFTEKGQRYGSSWMLLLRQSP